MFKHQIRVAYRDVTVGNHIYYARYLDLLEVARNEVFRELGHPLLDLQNQNIIFPVVECQIQYHAPARYDDLIEIQTSVSELRKIQLSLSYQIFREGKLITSAMTRHVSTDLHEKPARIPSFLTEALEKFIGSGEAQTD